MGKTAKKRWRSPIALLTAAVMACTLLPMPVVGAEETPVEKTAMQEYVEEMQPGWNLGNTFDATGGGETGWGNPVTTKEMIQFLADAGFKSLRLPVTWGYRTDELDNYKIQPQLLERLKEIIDWCLEADMKVMLNTHHDSDWIREGMAQDHDEVMKKYRAIWTQVADYFKDYPPELMFEPVNEPRFSDDWGENKPEYFEWVEELTVACHEIVRNSGGNNATRPLVVTPAVSSADQVRVDELVKTIEKLNDPNLIATVHYYGKWAFSVNLAGETEFDQSVKDEIDTMVNTVYDAFVSKGIPVVIGEFGLLGFDKATDTVEHGEMLKYFEYFTQATREKGITIMLWDNGQHLDRNNLVWRDQDMIDTILYGATQGRSSYANRDFLYIKQGEEVTDATMTLELNGNTLQEIWNGDTLLQEGTDYTVSEDGTAVTFPAAFLSALTEGQELGSVATLRMVFSAGVDWKVDVRYYDTPQLASLEDLAMDFGIPTFFNGDQLATMEATYTDGTGNAGPINWSSYQEFNAAFRPDYENYKLYVRESFWDAANDGEILLKFHFWSGEVVPYTVTKLGTWVTGVSSDEPEGYPGLPPLPGSESSTEDSQTEDTEDPPVESVSTEPTENTALPWIIVVAVLAVAVVIVAVIAVKKKK